jgi:hypothetical protein
MKLFSAAFLSPELEDKLSKEGYVVLPLLSQEEIEAVRAFYLKSKPSVSSEGFHSTHFSKDRAYKKTVHDFLKEVFQPYIQANLPGYRVAFCNFMVKEPGANSRMPLHTDWTYVDESKHRSLALWCALSDTSELNGALGVVPKSHLLPHNIRGPKIKTPFHDFNEDLITHAGKLLEISAGTAVIYDHRLMHFSPPNLSKDTRIALNLILLPNEVSVKHYCVLDDPNQIVGYDVGADDFFLNYDAFEMPFTDSAPTIIPNPKISFSAQELAEFLPRIAWNAAQAPWWKKWWAMKKQTPSANPNEKPE